MIVVDNENILVEKLEIEIKNTGHITNTYILKDKKTNKGIVIDPAYDEKLIENKLKELQVTLEKILVTHSHADHIAALAKLQKDTDVNVYIHNLDYDGLFDKTLNEEEIVCAKVDAVDISSIIKVKNCDKVTIGDISLEVIHTPGHTKGGIVLYNEQNNILFSGDTIFERTYGRTDLITGSHEDMKNSLNILCDRFDDILVLPGHGEIFNLKDSKRRIRLLFAYKG